jgi:hypothetical protein
LGKTEITYSILNKASRAEMKEMKGLIKAKKGLKRETIGNIKENIEK